ncbi:DUF5710 domain-containing protein [Anaerocolumna cellulosilytica]|nr:DUF5710 domain-containing protein [Anaerocolumna cellulosilytica]MBB5196091.1 hypothetical protein [Anaerocolumna cellulosilytica]
MPLYLNVPYDEKDDAKWSPRKKQWYVERKEDYIKFRR